MLFYSAFAVGARGRDAGSCQVAWSDHDKLKAMMHSNCPRAHWLDRLAPKLAAQWWRTALTAGEATPRPYVYFVVGANKGFEVASIYQRVANASLTNQQWVQTLQSYGKRKKRKVYRDCGAVCNTCLDSPARIAAPVAVSVHAFEMMRSNADWLRFAFEVFGLSASTQLVETVVSNRNGVATVPNASAALMVGFERGVAAAGGHADSDGGSGVQSSRTTTLVPMVTLDHYMRERGIAHVNHVAIDAEGFDPLVIEGMQRSLGERRIDVLEFEYGSVGYWSEKQADKSLRARTLEGTLSLLSGVGYTCFIQGNGGCIIPASGACYVPALGASHAWSNFVCAHGHGPNGGPAVALWELSSEQLRQQQQRANSQADEHLGQRAHPAWCDLSSDPPRG
jgi:FkbM family methyltransferase